VALRVGHRRGAVAPHHAAAHHLDVGHGQQLLEERPLGECRFDPERSVLVRDPRAGFAGGAIGGAGADHHHLAPLEGVEGQSPEHQRHGGQGDADGHQQPHETTPSTRS